MKNQKLTVFSIALSIVAIGVGLYAAVLAGGLDFIKPKVEAPKEKVAVNKEFKEQVYAVIDEYVKEKQAEAAQEQAPKPQTEPIEVSIDDDPMKGDKNAPVTLVEFSDYECPFCGKFYNETHAKIVENYVKTGKVKYVYRDGPLPFHSNAVPAANAAECVREQGGDEMYFKYHDILFKNQKQLSVDNYKTWAKDLPIDQAKFGKCVDEGKYNDEVAKDFADAQKYAAEVGQRFGTPFFFINGMALSGAMPYATFEQAIEAALEKK